MPPFVVLIVMAVVFTAIVAIIQGAYFAYLAREEAEKKELSRRLGMLGGEGAAGHGQESLFRDQAADAAAKALGNIGKHLQETINAADIDMTVTNLLGRMALFAGVGWLIGLVLMGFNGSILTALLGSFLPYILVRRAATARAKKLVEQLPDALDLISRSLQAGVGLNDTFRTVAEEMPFPIAAEFGRVFEEVRFGREFRHAMENLIERNPTIFDMRLFVSSTLLARETGGNLIEILSSISQTIRQRFLFFHKVKAMTSEARTSAMVLGTLPLMVGMIITLMRPEYIAPLFNDPLGNVFLAYSFCSYSSGIFLMSSLSNVEV